jgi:hypothetical protein
VVQNESGGLPELKADTYRLARFKPNLIVWPEYAIADYPLDNPKLLRELQDVARKMHSTLILGCKKHAADNARVDWLRRRAMITMEGMLFGNIALVIAPDGRILGEYHKTHPIHERTRRDDDAAPRSGRIEHFSSLDRDLGMRFDRGLNGFGESHAIDRECAARRQFVGIRRSHDQGIQPPHLFVQQPDRIVLPIIGAERVRAHQFGQALAGMRFCHALGPHLVQHNMAARLGRLPCRFASGESAADNVDRAHVFEITRNRASRQLSRAGCGLSMRALLI